MLLRRWMLRAPDLGWDVAEEAKEAWLAEDFRRHRTTHSDPSKWCEAARCAMLAVERQVHAEVEPDARYHDEEAAAALDGRLAHDAAAVVAAVAGRWELRLRTVQEA